MTNNTKRGLQVGLSLVVAAFFLYLAFRDTDFHSVAIELGRVDYLWLLPAIGCWVIIQFVRVLRFGVLIEPFAGRVPFSSLFRIGNIGMFAVFALPLRLGELVRPYMLKREFKSSLSAGIGAVAAERVVDGLVVTLGFFVVTQAAQVPTELAYAGFLALLVFAGAAVTLGLVLVLGPRGASLIERLIGVVSPKLGKRIAEMTVSFAAGLQALSSPRALIRYLFATLLFWGLNGLANWVLFSALHLEQSLMVGYVLVALTVVALMLPSGPGMIGPAQAAVAKGLVAFGCDPARAVAYAIITHLMAALTTGGFGLYSLATSHTGMTQLVEDANSSS